MEEVAPRKSEKAKRMWESGAKGGFHAVVEWLRAGDEGEKEALFFGGDSIVFADVVVASFLVWIRFTFTEDSEEWRGVLEWDGGRWARFMEAFRKCEEVDMGSFAEV